MARRELLMLIATSMWRPTIGGGGGGGSGGVGGRSLSSGERAEATTDDTTAAVADTPEAHVGSKKRPMPDGLGDMTKGQRKNWKDRYWR